MARKQSTGSQYVELMELRKACLRQGREDLAQELMEAADELVVAGLVSKEELTAAAYV